MRDPRTAIILLCLALRAGPAAGADCAAATDRVIAALDLTGPAQEARLRAALALCPDHPEAHNNLGVVLERSGRLEQAVAHYRAALAARPDYLDAWLGLGDAYRQQGRLPLALEAYLHACPRDREAKARAKALLKDGRYRAGEAGRVLDKDSLLRLYDPARRQAIARLVAACGLRASVEPVAVFRNFQFATGRADLPPGAGPQLKAIAQALLELDPDRVLIEGHTDRQPYRGHGQAESDALNLALSRRRAATLRQALAARGVPLDTLTARGHGPHQPLAPGDRPQDHARNRRVEIHVP
jgi:outer membrane protein OmpA-like peptidoglycan-associated protein